MEASVQYRPEIDGLRAIAVVPVILFHAGLDTLSGGFVGVDIFFVISGYLITSILMRDLEAQRFSILKFYEKRARRILPALMLVSVVSIPFAIWLLPPTDLNQYFKSLFGIATFSSNFVFYIQADYFDTSAGYKPMLHTWSLAVEEQYYILFPPLLALAWRWRRQTLLPLLAFAFVASLAVTEFVIGVEPSLAFYMLPFRAWELALGGMLAVIALEQRWFGSYRMAQVGSAAGMAMIAIAILAIEESDPFPGLIALVPTVGTALVIHFARPGTLACRLLSLKSMVTIGLISYSAYLWHQPLLSFTRHFHPLEAPVPALAAAVLATFVLAWLSWRFVEQPFRDRQRIASKAIFVLSLAGLASLAIAGFGGAKLAPLFDSPALARSPQLLAYRYDNRALQSESWQVLSKFSGSRAYGVTDNWVDNSLWFDPADSRPGLLVIGNSHAKDVFNTLFNSDTVRSRYQLARYGTQIVDAERTALNSPNYRAARIIVIASRYSM